MFINSFIKWFRPSLEDNAGSASYRRISAIIFMALICFMVIADKFPDKLHLYAFFALLITFLLLIAVVTLDSLSQAWARVRGTGYDPPDPKPDPIVKTTTEITPQ